MNKIFKAKKNLGKAAYIGTRRSNLVQLELELRNKESARDWETLEPVENVIELSICGSIWNHIGSDIYSGGQNIAECVGFFPTKENRRIRQIWREYHLNDMNAGTKAQTEFLDTVKKETGWKYDYSVACNMLKIAGLYEDRGYKYGHGWLYRPIPVEVIEEIKSLFEGAN